MTDWAWFTQAFGAAVSDINKKLIQESWYGRRGNAPGEHRPQPREHEAKEAEHDPLGRTLDRGIDR